MMHVFYSLFLLLFFMHKHSTCNWAVVNWCMHLLHGERKKSKQLRRKTNKEVLHKVRFFLIPALSFNFVPILSLF